MGRDDTGMTTPRPLRLLALAAAALLATGCGRAWFSTLNAGARAPAAEGVVYDPPRGLALDIYRPAATPGAAPAPVLVFFYGGSWQNGRREDYRFVGEAFAARGVVAVIPDYRRWPDAGFPAFVEDGARAAAWARANAARLGGDPDRVFLGGHSAGAHIAAMLATDARFLAAEGLAPRDFAGLLGLAGPYDFLPLEDPTLEAIFGPEAGREASQPVAFVDGDEPPALLLHGERDALVEPRNTASLAAAWRAAGVPVDARVLPGLGHVRLLGTLRTGRDDSWGPIEAFLRTPAPDTAALPAPPAEAPAASGDR